MNKSNKPNVTPLIRQMSFVEPTEVSWLWPGRIALGRITVLAGDAGGGKSFLCCDIAARISSGMPWVEDCPCPQADVVIMNAEDDPSDTIRPRLEAMRADLNRVHLLEGQVRTGASGDKQTVPISLKDIETIEETLRRLHDPKLIIIDPIGSYFGSGADSHRDTDVRALLAPLGQIARDHKVAILLVAHYRKSPGDRADDRVMGSRAFTGIARSVHHLLPDPSDAERRLLLPGKSNLGKAPNGLAFTITGEPARIEWSDEPVEFTAEEVMSAFTAKSGNRARDNAKAWLAETLREAPLPAKDIIARAEEAGIKERTLNRAKREAGVKSSPRQGPDGKHWVWQSPAAYTDDGIEPL